MKLYTHQKTALELLKDNPSFALFWDAGCGKTIPTITHILHLIRNAKIDNALIVAPKATLGAWNRDVLKFSYSEQAEWNNRVVVINYDKVWRTPEYKKKWDCIVLDESHCIKNHHSKRAQFLLKLAIDAKYRYILTGTPIGNKHIEEIWSQYAFLKPNCHKGWIGSEWLGSYGKFLDRYCYLNKYYKPYAYRNVDEIQKTINEHCYRLTKNEALDLPEQLPDDIHRLEMGNTEKNYYKTLVSKGGIAKFDILCDNPLSLLSKLRQLCSGYLCDATNIKSTKLNALAEFLDNWDKKLVIFAEFKRSIATIKSQLSKLGINFIVLDGEQPNKNIWQDFQKDESIQVIICQYKSANAGIDLFAADTILYYEPTLSGIIYEQSRGRIHRIGQHYPCSYVHFITEGTIEEQIYQTISQSQEFTEKLFIDYMNEFQTRSFK